MVKYYAILISVILALFGYLKHQYDTINDLKREVLTKEKELQYERDKAIYLHERLKLDSLVRDFMQREPIHELTERIIIKYENKADSIISAGDSTVNAFITSYLDAYAIGVTRSID